MEETAEMQETEETAETGLTTWPADWARLPDLWWRERLVGRPAVHTGLSTLCHLVHLVLIVRRLADQDLTNVLAGLTDLAEDLTKDPAGLIGRTGPVVGPIVRADHTDPVAGPTGHAGLTDPTGAGSIVRSRPLTLKC